jgi:hypothetical protein
MSDKDTGGPAFPINNPDIETFKFRTTDELRRLMSGMTVRQYFAAHAPEPPVCWHGGDRNLSDIIAWRWWYADAMLKDGKK